MRIGRVLKTLPRVLSLLVPEGVTSDLHTEMAADVLGRNLFEGKS
jgi:hypothetical protein